MLTILRSDIRPVLLFMLAMAAVACQDQSSAHHVNVNTSGDTNTADVFGTGDAGSATDGAGHTDTDLASDGGGAVDGGVDGANADDIGVDTAHPADMGIDVVDAEGDLPDPPGTVIDISAGEGHSCALHTDGQVSCWGRVYESSLRQDIDGNMFEVPSVINGLPDDLVQIASGGVPAYHDGRTCVVSAGRGEVWCWGNNNSGAIVANEEIHEVIEPMRVEGVSGAVAVETGYMHTCALLADNTVSCWGGNEHGGLGRRVGSLSNIYYRSAEVIEGLNDVVALTVGNIDHTTWYGAHSCATRSDGSLWCWGNNFYGQVGNGERSGGATADGVSAPNKAVGLPGMVADAAAGSSHTCAALADGDVYCWGNNDRGQLGVDPTELDASPVPVRVLGLDGAAVSVITGGKFSCARLDDGQSVQCWGAADEAQLGNGIAEDHYEPQHVAFTNAVALPIARLEAGGRHACAVDAAGNPWCWGSNRAEAQLGAGLHTRSEEATQVVDMMNTVQMSSGPAHTCALDDSGGIWCWGANDRGQLGTGRLSSNTRPQRVMLPPGVVAVEIATGGSDDPWGAYHGSFSCALDDAGGVWCWGAGSDGQMGHGETPRSQHTPVAVSGIADAHTIALGSQHACALHGSGDVSCWGYNQQGQLGDGLQSTERPALPIAVVGLPEPIDAISAGDVHTCALAAGSGQVYCWGANEQYQVGGDDPAPVVTPRLVAGLTDAVMVSAGRSYSCAVRSGGSVVCWGLNANGELGTGERGAHPEPVEVPDLTDAVSVDIGEGAAQIASNLQRTCVTHSDGAVSCWSTRSEDLEIEGYIPRPERRDDICEDVAQVSVGYRHACVLCANDGVLQCFGDTRSGQTGNGVHPFAPVPVQVIFATP